MVTIQSLKQVGINALLVEYSSDLPTPTFYIYIDGILVTQTNQTEYMLLVSSTDNIIIEILDTAAAVPTEVFPGRIRLGWFWSDNTDYYRIDEYIASVWTERVKIKDNTGYMDWQSRFLEDEQSHQFRLVPIGTNGNEGVAKEVTILMIRHPDTPDVSYAYSDSTNKVTITAS